MSHTLKSLQSIVKKIIAHYHPDKVVLFGSYAWGKPHADSDVDLFIIKKTRKPTLERIREVDELLADRDIALDVLVYTPAQVERRLKLNDPFIRSIVSRGKVLYEAT